MSKSELFLRFSTKIGKKDIVIPDIKVADGVIATEMLPTQAAPSRLLRKTSSNVIQDAQKPVFFLIQQSKLRDEELNSAPVKDLTGKIVESGSNASKKITSIEVSSYASPDGPTDLNEKLAGEREKSTVDFLNKSIKSANLTTPVDARFTAEDWDGFQQLVSASSMQDKDLIIRVLSMYQDPEKREQEIKNLSAVYKNLADEILPQAETFQDENHHGRNWANRMMN